jgi:hypothetical protein
MWSTIFNAIGDFSMWMFQFLPIIGMAVAVIFWCLIAIGCFYWLYYGMRLEKGGDNYLAVRGDEEKK